MASYKLLAAFSTIPSSENLKKMDDNYKISLKTGSYLNLYNMLKNEESTSSEILWRKARAFRLYALNDAKRDKDLGKTKINNLLIDAYNFSDLALKNDSSNWAAHKWYGITLGDKAELEGSKSQLLTSISIKEHFEKAIELNGNDATTIHSLGLWHYTFADMSWMMRNLASTIFAKVPDSSYEEALKYFKLAEEIEPGFYSKNLLFLAKCYKNLGQLDKFIEIKEKLLKIEILDSDDQESIDEIKKL